MHVRCGDGSQNRARRDEKRRQVLLTLLALGGTLSTVGAYAADPYPSRPVKIVVPFPAGGAVDQLGRILADEFQRASGQPAYVENRPGASGTLGAATVAKAAPDGYTLLLTSATTQSIAPATMKTRPYDPTRDFSPVAQLVSNTPFVLLVHPSLQANNLQDLKKLLKSAPGKYAHGVSGVGSLIHLAGVQLESAADSKVMTVPYRGGQPALIDLVAGLLQFGFVDVGTALPYIRNGRLRAIAVVAPQRLSSLPDIQTFSEAGVPDFNMPGWMGLFAPPGTPPSIVDTLAKLTSKMLAEGPGRQRIEAIGLYPEYSDKATLQKNVEADLRATTELARRAKIEIE